MAWDKTQCGFCAPQTSPEPPIRNAGIPHFKPSVASGAASPRRVARRSMYSRTLVSLAFFAVVALDSTDSARFATMPVTTHLPRTKSTSDPYEIAPEMRQSLLHSGLNRLAASFDLAHQH